MSLFSQPQHTPLAGSHPQSDSNLISQSRETGDTVPNPQFRDNGSKITKDELVAKPWAHFVSGG